MALRKICDYSKCNAVLGDKPFLSFHGSISEQVEDSFGGVEYRYLTPASNYRFTVCSEACLFGLGTEWRERSQFQQRPVRQSRA